MITVVLDTNVVVRMFGRKSGLDKLLAAFLHGQMAVAISPAIWLEYQEVSMELGGAAQWSRLERVFDQVSALHKTVINVSPAFRFSTVIHDPDDNAFADCGIAAHADFVMTDDRHFRSLAGAGYKTQPITPLEFIDCYL